MFSGIVETTSSVRENRPSNGVCRLVLGRPADFQDIQKGDSIAVNGVCLTVEDFSPDWIQFAVGYETIQITGWDKLAAGTLVNLERSLRLGDRIHGHLVSGHVDALSRISKCENQGECRVLSLELPSTLSSYVWKKGSIAINGVSLTINSVSDSEFSVCLVPETLKRTNLGSLRSGDSVTLEVDQIARGIVESREKMKEAQL